MDYLLVDAKMPKHPKVRRLSHAAFRLHFDALCDCKMFQTDGFVAAAGLDGISQASAKHALIAEELVPAGLWVETEGGWLIHDYLEWNYSRAEIESIKEKRSASGRVGGLAKAKHSLSDSLANTVYVSGSVDQGSRAETTEQEATGVRARDPVADQVLGVLRHWAEKLHAGQRVKFDDKRKRRVRARFAEGFSVADLKLAIDGTLRDDWLMGRSEKSRKGGYRDVDTVLRDAAQVERLMGLTKDGAAALAKRPRTGVQAMGEGVVAVKTEDASSGLLGAVTPIGVRVEKRRPPTSEERALLEGIVGKIGTGGQR